MQMNRLDRFVATIMVFGALLATATAQSGYVTPSKPMAEELSIPPTRIGQIKVSADGAISFIDSYAAKHTFRRVEYKLIYTPMPKDVRAVKKAYFLLDMDSVIKSATAVSLRSKWLGWGAYVCYLHATALMEKGKFDDAKKVLKEATMRYAKHEKRVDLIRGAQKELRYAQAGGPKISAGKPKSLDIKLNGIALQRAKKTREAILQYMKVVTLFPVLTKKPEEGTDPETLRDLARATAYVRLVSLLSLKEIGDKSTAGVFAQELRDEYRLR